MPVHQTARERARTADKPTPAALIYVSDTETVEEPFRKAPDEGTIVVEHANIIYVNRVAYSHVGEAADGRWTYRPL